jgi:Membrane bound beta barrel domain (DUF5777)
LGVVPTFLRNPRILDYGTRNAFSLGLNGQYYVSDWMSLLGEWIVAPKQQERPYDSGSFGVELQTHGHFFKVLLTNQALMDPTQFLGGAEFAFKPKEWRLGFNITRLMPF